MTDAPSPTPAPRSRVRALLVHLGWAVALVAVAVAVAQYRRAFIQTFFVLGTDKAPPPALAQPAAGAQVPALPPAARVRAVLIDGVDRATAARMPNYDALCARGLDLVVDAGFPTVSLPIQSALWSGLTQQQTGIQFIGKALDAPLSDSVAGRVADSVAVVEYYPFIAGSAGFRLVLPTAEFTGTDRDQWVATGFMPAAEAIMASNSRLAFVHILRVDSAGHKNGRVSAEFEQAVRDADLMLGALVAAEGGRPDTRWLLLADHGHRAGGGHGGTEDAIRLVRACVAGNLGPVSSSPTSAVIHMIDLARVVADSLGVPMPAESAARPLAAALAAPSEPGATLPAPTSGRWILAALILLAALAVTLLATRGAAGAGQGVRAALWAWPLWWLVAWGAIALLAEPPSMSVPMVYKPWGKEIATAGLPGLLVLLPCAFVALGRLSPTRATAALLAVPLALAAAAHILCWGTPPLVPGWTARTSVFLTLLASGAAVVALVHLVRGVLSASGRARPAASAPARS